MCCARGASAISTIKNRARAQLLRDHAPARLLPSGSVTSNHANDDAFLAVFEQSPKWLRCDLEQPGATKVTLQGGGPA